MHLPFCEHTARLGDAVILPDETWAFDGFAPYVLDRSYPPRSIRILLVAGDKSAR